jgi:hypothetical protein
VTVVSLALNIVVLVGVTAALTREARWTQRAYGERSAARNILLAIYIAILIASVALLVGTTWAPADWQSGAVLGLLGVQIVYKVITAFTVRDALRNPVVVSNLAIAAVHAITVATIMPSL